LLPLKVFCIGGGVALGVALDFRIMASNAHIRVPEIGLGMNMSWQSGIVRTGLRAIDPVRYWPTPKVIIRRGLQMPVCCQRSLSKN
jgi:hypothetical protein